MNLLALTTWPRKSRIPMSMSVAWEVCQWARPRFSNIHSFATQG